VMTTGYFQTSHLLQDQVITWEIKAFFLLLGAAIAGTSTFNGVKQGLCVGVLSTGILVAAAPSSAPVIVLILTMTSCVLLSLVGGWFGCQLLPPVLKRRETITVY